MNKKEKAKLRELVNRLNDAVGWTKDRARGSAICDQMWFNEDEIENIKLEMLELSK